MLNSATSVTEYGLLYGLLPLWLRIQLRNQDKAEQLQKHIS